MGSNEGGEIGRATNRGKGQPHGPSSNPVTAVSKCAIAVLCAEWEETREEQTAQGSKAPPEADRPAIRRARRSNAVVGLEELLVLREAHRQAGRKVVWADGYFGPLDASHDLALEAASGLGDVLVVGVIGGEALRERTGAGQVVPAKERAEAVAALACVAHVLIVEGVTLDQVLERLRPDVHCLGTDRSPPDGRRFPDRIHAVDLSVVVDTDKLPRPVRAREGDVEAVVDWFPVLSTAHLPPPS